MELEVAIADQRAGQQVRFGQDLKAVADAEDEDGPPLSANCFTARITGLNRAIAPQRK